jgi:plasmid stabilization system protein ParE
MKTYRLLDKAEAEILDAALYYQEQMAGLGADFLDAVDKAFTEILEAPDRWPIVRVNVRRHFLRRFPYSIFYRVDAGEILILAVGHLRRRPWYWKQRME